MRLLAVAAVLALAAARPETYRESEDFQYSRSSTDEGSRSGYYGAQRGNMGGNYERAHNMDGLAQHQMSTAVKQVEGELGEASKMKSGTVFTSANSGGMFGSGHYDVSNLQGRNFQDSAGSYGTGETQSHSSLSSHQSGYNDQLSSSMQNSGYNSISQNSGYRRRQGLKTGQALQSSDLLAAGNVHDANYDYGSHADTSSHSSGHSSQSGYQSHSAYDMNNANQYISHQDYENSPQSKIIYATPVRIVGRPGTRVAIPVRVQTYDGTHSASTLGQEDAETLSNADQHISQKPAFDAKRYESSYSYRKQWEKHNVQPEVIALATPTESPFPQNSELYEDAQTSNNQYHESGFNSQSGHTNSMRNAYNSNKKSSSLSATQLQEAAADTVSSSNSNAYNSANSADTANILGGIDTKPKSYQSSYSYHKSWERQGDPYVIKPVGEASTGQDLQRLTATSTNHGYSSHQAGSNYHQTHQGYSHGLEDSDCGVNGYQRVARSIRNQHDQIQNEDAFGQQAELQQQTQNSWDRAADLTQLDNHRRGQVQQEGDRDFGQQVQQNQWNNLEDLGQHTQNSWDTSADLRQTPNHQRAQQEEDKDLEQQVQKHQWGKLEDLGQHTQNSWDDSADLRQMHNHQQAQVQQEEEKDFGQQVHPNQWSNFGKLIHSDRPADLRQAQHHRPAQAHRESETDFGQQVQQNQWEDLTQQVQQNKWDNSETNGQIQRHSDQDILDVWPEYISEQQQSTNFKPASQPSLLDFTHEQSALEDQQPMMQAVLSDSSREQQGPSNGWLDQDQQEIQTDALGKESFQQTSHDDGIENLDQMYLRTQDREETQQQANKPWGGLEYLDQHKNTEQQQEEKVSAPVWSSTNNQGHAYNNPPSTSYNYQKVNQQSDKGAFGLYDWSQASLEKTNFDKSQLGNFWDKIGEAVENNDNIDLTLNKDQHHDSQHNIIFTSTTLKPNNADITITENLQPINGISITTEKTQVVLGISHADFGRGDIGPEEDNVVRNQNTNTNLFKTPGEIIPLSITKENSKDSHTADQVTQVNNNGESFNKWYNEERKVAQFYNLNSTFNKSEDSSWGQPYNYFGSSNQNQSLHRGQQAGFSSDKTNTHFNEDFFNQNAGNNKSSNTESIAELTIVNQDFIPTTTLKNLLPNKIPEEIFERTEPQKSIEISKFHESPGHKNKYNFKVEKADLEQIHQDVYNWRKSENNSEMVWGQSLNSFMQMPQQDKAETFGVRFMDERDKTTPETQKMAEQFKRESIKEPGDVHNMTNHNIQHYNKEKYNEMPENLQPPEPIKKMQDIQEPQNNANINFPVEPTTIKPGFWKNAKNTFVSWFKSS